MSSKTLPGVLVSAAEQRPGAVAIREEGLSRTNQELLSDVRGAAKGFIAAGLQKGERFSIWAPNLASWIIAALGGQMVGGVLVPLNTRYKGPEAADILARSQSRLLFTVRGFLGADYPAMLEGHDLPGLTQIICLKDEAGTAEWETFMAAGSGVTDETLDQRFDAVGPDDLCDILFTSGTTGQPKGAMTAHGQNVEVYSAWADAVGLNTDDVYLIANPFFHAFGYKAGWLSAIIGGALILPHSVFDTDVILQRIEAEKVSVLPGPPTIFQSLINAPSLASYDISSLSKTITGAASVPEQLIADMRNILGFDTVLTGYGLTESSGTVTLSQRGDDIETIANYSGRPLKGVEVCLIASDGSVCNPGETGEIKVRGFNVMRGYLDDPGATAKAIDADGWLATGDIGIQDERGYLKITDRAKDMFITGGFNCYPAEIENALLAHDDIMDVAVVGDPDERMGEVCHAHIVARKDVKLTGDDVIAWARGAMANFKTPRKVTFHEELPRNAGGKVQKFKLRS